jgi:hypothetical protein
MPVKASYAFTRIIEKFKKEERCDPEKGLLEI